MTHTRRDFLRTATGFTIAGMASRFGAMGSPLLAPDRKAKIAVLHEPDFPSADGITTDEGIRSALTDFSVEWIRHNHADALLTSDLCITPYGSSFPADFWPLLEQYLVSGGHWINLGGTPLALPVIRTPAGWKEADHTTAFGRKLGILQSFRIASYAVDEFRGELDPKWIDVDAVHELYLRLTDTVDFPDEDGPAGTMDRRVHSLSAGLDSAGVKIAAPVIEIENMLGLFAGGKWIFATFEGTITGDGIRVLVARALAGVAELQCTTSFACYFPGERPSLTVQVRTPNMNTTEILEGSAEVTISGPGGDRHHAVELIPSGRLATAMLTPQGDFSAPGLYRVKVRQRLRDQLLSHTTGFWVRDENLIASGKPLRITSDHFVQDGKTKIITGTSYMASDVHRKFLFAPNPAVWDADFHDMKQAGVNMVRTGIWTAWRHYMLDPGNPAETTLRAIDAFVLTARKYDIPLIFTFFAFLPEDWNGENPYLDPRSVRAQQEFLSAIARRFGRVNDIIWDFINEPSFCSDKHLWYCRPNYDRFEEAAWKSWFAGNDGSRFGHTSFPLEDDSLPSLDDFQDAGIVGDRQPVKALDYRRFAQEMFRRWVVEMTKAVRENGNRNQLITVGQDEGGTYERPGPQFFGDLVDFTSLHNWWLNDDLLWDSVVTNVSGKPHLVEETGVMFAQKHDGTPWRTEEEAAALLERKLAVSIGSGGAGFIEWIWNANPYMRSDNEPAIGLHRADGTAKPEFFVFSRYARFFAEHSHLMTELRNPDAVLLIPHTQMWFPRNLATEATRRSVRVLANHCDVIPGAASEYTLHILHHRPSLVIVPNPVALSESCWSELIRLSQKGTHVLITGTFDRDEHWRAVKRTSQLGFDSSTKPVAQEEVLRLNGEHRVSFRGDKTLTTEKGIVSGEDPGDVLNIANRRLLWSPLPVELGETPGAVIALYLHALKWAKIETIYHRPESDPSVLILPQQFSEVSLYTLVSESDQNKTVSFADRRSGREFTIGLKAGRSALLLIRRDGSEIARME